MECQHILCDSIVINAMFCELIFVDFSCIQVLSCSCGSSRYCLSSLFYFVCSRLFMLNDVDMHIVLSAHLIGAAIFIGHCMSMVAC